MMRTNCPKPRAVANLAVALRHVASFTDLTHEEVDCMARMAHQRFPLTAARSAPLGHSAYLP